MDGWQLNLRVRISNALRGGWGYCTVGDDLNNNGVRKKNILWFFEIVFFVILCKTEGTYIH